MRTLFLSTVCGLALLSGCQSYEPLPLDVPGHIAGWRDRDPGGDDVRRFAAELAARDSRPRGVFNPQDGIDLDEAEAIALFFNADLRVARLEADAMLAGAEAAGSWADPELALDGARILQSVSNPWILAASIEITIPFSGRPGVEQDLAFARHDAGRRAVIFLEWGVLTELREAWRELAAVDRRIEAGRLFRDDLKRVGEIAAKLAQSGDLGRVEARVFEIELAEVDAELIKLAGEREQLVLSIKEAMGLRPGAPLELSPSLTSGDDMRSLTNRRNRVLKNSPELALHRARYEIAEQELRLEIRKQYPDLVIGPGYELEEGQSRIALGLGLPIPVINLNREGIALARGNRLAAKAGFESELERTLHRLASAESRLATASATRVQIETRLAPLIDAQLADARKLAELGEFDVFLQLEAVRSARDTKLRLVEARLGEARAMDGIVALMGPGFVPAEEEIERK